MVTLERESHDLLSTDCGPQPCPSQAWWGAGEPGGSEGKSPTQGDCWDGIW